MKDINNEVELEYYCDRHRHLVCIPYSVDNLHLMAKDLGIRPSWYHRKRRAHHYDIPIRSFPEVLSKSTLVTSREIWKIIEGTFVIVVNQEN